MREGKQEGTTILGIKGKDYVVLAADKQSTYGPMKYSRMERKIHPIADYIALAGSGLVGDIQILVRFLENRVASMEIELGEKPSPESITKYLSLILNANKYFPYWVGIIIGGYKNAPYLASIDSTGSVTDNKHYVVEGSGMPYAAAVIEDRYKEGIKLEDAIALAIRAVEASRKLDIYSGGDEPGIDVAIVDKDGVKLLGEKEIAAYKR